MQNQNNPQKTTVNSLADIQGIFKNGNGPIKSEDKTTAVKQEDVTQEPTTAVETTKPVETPQTRPVVQTSNEQVKVTKKAVSRPVLTENTLVYEVNKLPPVGKEGCGYQLPNGNTFIVVNGVFKKVQ